MVNIIKQELEIEESLRKKIEFICEFTNIKPTFKNGYIRKIDKTNLIYIEPHSITIKNINFLFFKYFKFILQFIRSTHFQFHEISLKRSQKYS